MSISESAAGATDFERWLEAEVTEIGSFTALVVLVAIGDTKVTPLCSTHFNVIGVEVDWSDITLLFAGAGVDWDGACFFPMTSPRGAPLDNPTARLKLRDLEARLNDDRLVLNEGHFFDKLGRRLQIEEVQLQ